LLGNDFFDAYFNIAHGFPLRVVKQAVILPGRRNLLPTGYRTDTSAF
jgi:hypothetical protein